MKRFSLQTVLALALIVFTAQFSQAFTINVSPARVRIGSALTATVRASYTNYPGGCQSQVNFGDGGGWATIGSCTTLSCTFSANHTYSNTGTYAVQVRGGASASCATLLVPPTQASTTATVCGRLAFSGSAALPAARLGTVYNSQLTCATSGQSVTYRVVGGSLPPGLTLSPTGLINGTPTRSGDFSFVVQASDACGGTALAVRRTYGLSVGGVSLDVTASPSSAQVRPDVATPLSLRYSVRCNSTAPLSFSSGQGVFVADGQSVGTVNTPLNVTVSGGSGSAAETITVPPSVVQKAAALGAGSLQYRRAYSLGGVNVGQSVVDLSPLQKALGNLRVRKISLYFDDNRPEITVKRYATGLRATARITYEGSGQLLAYWEVDGRVISHETLNLIYGKRSIELQTPQSPALPTFAQGTHRVRLVITSPAMDIDWPVAIYYVESARAAAVAPIAKAQPPCGVHRAYAPLGFSWSAAKGARVYVVEFFPASEDKPFFAAQTRQNAYDLPKALLEKYFKPGTAYAWWVRALDDQGTVVAESPLCDLTFKP